MAMDPCVAPSIAPRGEDYLHCSKTTETTIIHCTSDRHSQRVILLTRMEILLLYVWRFESLSMARWAYLRAIITDVDSSWTQGFDEEGS